ncbi:hypothetical protein DFH06DRAFT_1315537 [Mycena polygramma]|nr:hypothetical protein DFH06DRAFT_1315537 [Mycena polygramma]
MTTISDATPIAWARPYLVCHDTSSKTLSLWTCTGDPKLHVILEGETSTTPRLRESYVVAPDRVIMQRVDDMAVTILVYSLSDGQLLDAYALGPGAVSISRQGLIAKWENERGKWQVYTLAENGKLTVVEELSSPAEERHSNLSESHIPDSVYLTSETFIQSQVRHPDPTVHLTRISAGTPRRTSFGLAREIPDDMLGVVMSSELIDAVPISSSTSSAFVMAHVERVWGFNEYYPKTALRSIDPQTLVLGWCTLITQQTEWLRYSAASGIVVAYGWMGMKQDTEVPMGKGIVVLDATTGAILRTESIGMPKKKCSGNVHCDLTPSGDELVVVFEDGQLAVAPLDTFVAKGFAREGDSGALVTIPCPEFALSTPKNSRERRDKAHDGAWKWIKRVFVADGFVVVVPNRGTDFGILRW